MTGTRIVGMYGAVAGAALAVLIMAAIAGGGLVRPASSAAPPLDPAIPDERLLLARGLAGVPGPGQPTYPLAVDRVLTDGAATYVQFHVTGPLGSPPALIPELSDDTGAIVPGWGAAGFTPSGLAFPLPAWLPWHPPRVVRGYAILGPLSPQAHAAVLRFVSGETVRVPLDLAALRHPRAYSSPPMQRGALQFQVVAAREMSLLLDFSAAGGLRNVTLTDARGHAIPLHRLLVGCGDPVAGGPLPCQEAWAYPPQPAGARLTLALQAVGPTPGTGTQAANAGSWRLAFTVP